MEDVMEGGYEDMYAEEAQPMKKGVLEQVKLFPVLKNHVSYRIASSFL